jgi:predicted choloylglycine hydrolase
MPHAAYVEIEADTPAALGRALAGRFGRFVAESAAEARAQRDWGRKLAIAAKQISLTRQHFPRCVEELEAYAEAAALPLAHVWVVMCEDELDAAAERCTTFVANDGRLVAHNEDWDADAAESICVLRKTLDRLTTLEIYYFNTPLGGSAVSVNSHGLVQAINSLSHADRAVGVPRNVVARWLSETRDPEEALRALGRVPRSAGYNHVLVGGPGLIWNLECSAAHQAAWRPALPFVHTNHFLADALADLEAAAADDTTHRRYRAALASVKGAMTPAEAVALLGGDASPGGRAGIFNRDTIASVVVDLDARVARIWLRREAEAGWIAYPLDFIGK